ncbi:MAG: acetyl-CoA carboxylase carboxyl transferase subunit alpha [Campylobacteraceae bacterium]|jgi:acetyl-CoA carboxylase carboxyl transferase subunit alpha|nr:acetyl-CoA carboxylase carboxyl transferase subunit alpha [Campylobacteraceae bacterium]MBT3881915.1 acetyl-CoA carboxylase carboxyl transferase subunit alpha [Campylobacteraceae bacterium]MBT4030781.1 acetyl-CoA carboxylase carboxyl transferase subunit alpha [Campylobacteraceae bacterium]MBT4178728.1 acetyl-CoA carboxylase carboxyl transferase subunit alpha [Campylobacteraceae bacterium]MBT4572091.1 acetyl-CoA carboxylase carboxyl transferase subunit alpha [Campylobacteraceae bacterium]
MATYLDFEENLQRIEEEIIVAKTKADEYAVATLEKKLQAEVEKTYGNLDDFQKLKLARHIDRPYALDYIRALLTDKYEIHGDRHLADDAAMLCYFGHIGDQKVLVIGEQKGRGVKNKIKRNFGMPNPEGYRKALRAAKLAEKFSIPIVMLVDTPGAYPGIGAEERSQSEAIAKNLFEFSDLDTITISIVIGEGGSGGALAIGVADKLSMMRYSVYSVISPEGCAAILWSDPAKVETAAQALKITPTDLKEMKLIDDIINEPLIGAHRQKKEAFKAVGDYIIDSINELKLLSVEERKEKRYEKLMTLGSFE